MKFSFKNYLGGLCVAIFAFAGIWKLNGENKNDLALRRAASETSANFSIGGSCMSQGKWVADALKQANALKEIAAELEANPDCEVLYKALSGINTKNNWSQNEMKDKRDNSFGDMEDFHETTLESFESLSGDEFAPANMTSHATNLLSKTINHQIESRFLRDETAGGKNERLDHASIESLRIIDNIIAALPQSAKCITGQQKAVGSVINKSVAMLSAAASGYGIHAEKSINGLLSFLSNDKYRHLVQAVYTEEFATSMSCILETTANKWCRVKHAQKMLDFAGTRRKEWLDPRWHATEENPLEGYFLLLPDREVDLITEWLVYVQYGVQPRLITDAQYKNNTLNDVKELLTKNFNLEAMFNHQKKNYEIAVDIDAKKQKIMSILEEMVLLMTGGDWRGNSDSSDENFYKNIMAEDKIPFYLIGMDGDLPKNVVGGDDIISTISWSQWMRQGGKYREQFNDPDALLIVIENRMNSLKEKATRQASRFFRTRFIVDMPHLVDRAQSGKTLTVRESLGRVRNYYQRLFEKYSRSLDKGERIVPPSILGTIGQTTRKIEKILAAFDEVDEVNTKFLKDLKVLNPNLDLLVDIDDLDKVDRTFRELELAKEDMIQDLTEEEIQNKKIQESELYKEQFDAYQRIIEQSTAIASAYENVIKTVYDEFNVMLQRDSFASSRVNEHVLFDYKYYIESGKIKNKEVESILQVANDDLINGFLFGNIGFDPAETMTQVGDALRINDANIEMAEKLFGRALVPLIRRLDLEEIHGSARGTAEASATIIDLVKDSIHPLYTPAKAMANLLYQGEKYPVFSRIAIIEPTQWKETAGIRKAKLCIQSLMFENATNYADRCMGAEMKAFSGDQYDYNGKPLFISYSKLLKERIKWNEKYKKNKRKMSSRLKKERDEWRYHNTCAIKNWKRRNRVYRLLQQTYD